MRRGDTRCLRAVEAAAAALAVAALTACTTVPSLHAVAVTPLPVLVVPVADSDHDGVNDAYDACPTLPGIVSRVVVENGCPPPGYYDDGLAANDRDGDGVPDADDACPDRAALPSPAATTRGCPAPPDLDADGIPDAEDACPKDAGAASSDHETTGCPLAWIEGDRVRILSPIRFASGSVELLPESEPVLGAVTSCLTKHPELVKISVEGHTDDRGNREKNRLLGRRRAARVVDWLVAHGADGHHLLAEGIGADRPLDTNDTEDGRARNRRVEFHVLPYTPAP